MDAMGVAPMLIRNLMPNNINTDAIHKSETVNNPKGISGNPAKFITTKGEDPFKEIRENITSSKTATKDDSGDGTSDNNSQIYGIPNRVV